MYKYRQIYSDIKKNILTNHYRSGTLLPTQEFFSKKYNVSRITLKKALELLEKEGLIFSKQGSGTYVRTQIEDPSDELLPLDLPIGTTYTHRDQDIESKILHFSARLPEETEQINLSIGSNMPVYEYKRIRIINSDIYSFEHTIVPVSIAPLDENILSSSVYDYLGREINLQLTDARRIIFAEKATEEISEALKIEKNDPVLTIEQVAYDQNGRAFEYSHSYFRHNKTKFVLDVHLKNK